MAIPFRLPTYQDPRARLMARFGQLLHELMDTLGQLEQLQQLEDSVPVEANEWIVEEEGPDGPVQHNVSPHLLVEALRNAGPHFNPDTIERVGRLLYLFYFLVLVFVTPW
jgi:hypothetical protein